MHNRPDEPNAIAARNVGLTYSDGTEAVRNVSLTIPDGEFFGFLGPNGAGKTTMIKTLVTLLRPTSGQITVYGADVAERPGDVRNAIGYMAQETSVDAELTARENLHLACEFHHIPPGEHMDRIDELLALVDLADVADKRAETFSGGMKKRLDAATTLVHRPPLVFLDEPTTGLDPRARNRLWEYFREINDAGTTVFLTTQYLEEVDELCERIAVIADGEIVAMGDPDDLKAEVGGDVVEIGLENPTDARLDRARTTVQDAGVLEPDEVVSVNDGGITVTSPRAGRIGSDLIVTLRDADVTVIGFNVRSPTLDDVFLAITGDAIDDDRDNASRTDTDSPIELEARQ